MTTNEYDWTRFSVTFYYPVPLAKAYRAWATRSGLESFFVEVAEFADGVGESRDADELIEAGDTYSWTWRHGHRLTGQVREAVPNSFVELTFGSMIFRVTFTTAGALTTKVALEQRHIADDEDGRVMGHLNCRSCWTFFMTNLKSILLTGTDLRDDDPDRVSSMEVGYHGESVIV